MRNKKTITKRRLGLHLYLSLFLYAVVGLGLTLFLEYAFSKSDSTILSWFHWRSDVIFIVYLIIGFICIFNYFWNKPWGYLDEVISATQTVYEESDQPVELSDPLKESERQLNQIKMSVLLSRQAAKQAEDKKNEIIMYLAHDIRTPLNGIIGLLEIGEAHPENTKLLREKPIQRIAVKELCQEAGVNRSTFYSHYDSIGELMEELEQEIGANLMGRFREDNYDGEHPFSPGHLLPILEHIRDNRDFYRVYLSQSTAQHRMDWAFGQLLERYVRPLLRGLSVEEEAIAYYFAFFRAGFLALIQQWLQNLCQEEPEVILSYVQNLLRLPEIEGKQV